MSKGKLYHLWTVNAGSRTTVTCWATGSRTMCQRSNLSRFRGMGFVSTISDPDKARRRFAKLAPKPKTMVEISLSRGTISPFMFDVAYGRMSRSNTFERMEELRRSVAAVIGREPTDDELHIGIRIQKYPLRGRKPQHVWNGRPLEILPKPKRTP